MKNWIIRFAIGAVLIIGILFSYVWYLNENEFVDKYPRSIGSFSNVEYFSFDQDSILSALDENASTLFTAETDWSYGTAGDLPSSWREEDYDAIADKISQLVWDESLDQWKLYRMVFKTSCSENVSGLDWAEYIYFKEASKGGKRIYTTRVILTQPPYGVLAIGSDATFPRPFWGWKYIDQGAIKVTAEEAILAAEHRGGKSARIAMNNKCNIYVSMNPDGYGFREWKVSYSGNLNPADVDIFIKP